jgi:hypothetical protein
MTRAEWMTALRAAWDDADAVGRDMLRKPRKRQLGPAKHREVYRPAAATIEHLLDNPPDDTASDPKG